jgi:alkanesulfonate monooxygenase SsuD/methylene tetrahydromethanopterin reductase-like flavin-dependent oxidoreductase (luciferase family)
VTANPKPVQADVHTVVGGQSRRARRRAGELTHGWYGFMRDPETAAADVAQLHEAAERYERPDGLGRLEISITPAKRLKPGDLEAYAELGVDRLILQPGWHKPTDEILAYIEQYAPTG